MCKKHATFMDVVRYVSMHDRYITTADRDEIGIVGRNSRLEI